MPGVAGGRLTCSLGAGSARTASWLFASWFPRRFRASCGDCAAACPLALSAASRPALRLTASSGRIGKHDPGHPHAQHGQFIMQSAGLRHLTPHIGHAQSPRSAKTARHSSGNDSLPLVHTVNGSSCVTSPIRQSRRPSLKCITRWPILLGSSTARPSHPGSASS